MLALAHIVAALPAAAHSHHRFHGSPADYIAIALAAAASWLVVTGPGEAALIAAGIEGARHRVDIASVIAVAWIGAMTGGVAGWLIGLNVGRALMTAPGPLRRLRSRMLRSGERVYERHGLVAVYMAPTWMAGIHAMRASRFLPANALATLAWSLLLGLGSYFIGPTIADVASDIGLVGLALVVVAAAAALAARSRRVRRSELHKADGDAGRR